MVKKHSPVHQLELRVSTPSELFNSMDPAPFQHRDLDTEAEEFIESWALEFPQDSHFRIIVHIEAMPAGDPTPPVATAIHNYFKYKAVLATRSVRVLLLEGRTSLLIGVGFLAMCLLAADLLTPYVSNTFLRVVKESLLIGGWVAMWRPMQIFLYEWWPLVRRGRIYRSLGEAIVRVVAAPLSPVVPALDKP